MLKSIYLWGGIIGAVAVLVVGYVSHFPTETAPIASTGPTVSRTSPSLPPKPEPVRPSTANEEAALVLPYLGDKPIPHLPRFARNGIPVIACY